ncbi:MAG: ATPase [Elusimicrobia bacterium GWA2_69_24]|nr:MAG: ATPase [Elusimicrobia bacterium GWA2_69_24]HBL16207.1 ATPase [Elusimicrobiota bacterium]
MTQDIREINEKVQAESLFVAELKKELSNVIVGQEELLDRILVGLLSNGHILIEGVPGLAKTLTINTLAAAIDAKFQRIQFTPDLLPADLTGTLVFNQKDNTYMVRKGPVFSNLVLADEINRAPAKVQSALLESMQERQVTIGDSTYKLPELFMVLATQNPIEQEGTYPLPEAQVDRFMMKLLVTYPRKDEERVILERMTRGHAPKARKVVTPDKIFSARKVTDEIYVDDKVKNYIVDIVFATRKPEDHGLAKLKPLIRYGASPRATIFLTTAAKGFAFLNGRGFVTPEDVKSIGPDVLRHRLLVSYEAEAENVSSEEIIHSVFETVEVP